MKTRTWIAAGILAAFLVVPARTAGQSAGDLFLDKCANCHGADGAGQTVRGKKLKLPDLRSAEVQRMTDAQMNDLIAKGKGDMPGYAKVIQDRQIKELVAYLRSLAKK